MAWTAGVVNWIPKQGETRPTTGMYFPTFGVEQRSVLPQESGRARLAAMGLPGQAMNQAMPSLTTAPVAPTLPAGFEKPTISMGLGAWRGEPARFTAGGPWKADTVKGPTARSPLSLTQQTPQIGEPPTPFMQQFKRMFGHLPGQGKPMYRVGG